MRTFVIAAALAGSFALSTALPSGANAATLSGSWSGSGYVKPASGARENVRCRVTYSPISSKTVRVTATCASAATTIRQTGSLTKVREDRYIGDFFNSQYNVKGRVRVLIRGSSQTVTFSSSDGRGQLSLRRR